MMNKIKSAFGLGLIALGVSFASQAALLTGTYTFPGADPGGDAAVPTQANVTYGAFSRAGGVTFNSVSDVFSSLGWENTAYDPARYVQFVLTPATGYSLDLASFTFTNERGPNGPANGRVTMSWADNSINYDYSPSKNTAQTLTWDFNDFNAGVNTAVKIQFFGWGAKGNTGNDVTLDFDNVAFNGSVVPEPVNVALGVFAGIFALAGLVRTERVRRLF
jgi:hypothetical protein